MAHLAEGVASSQVAELLRGRRKVCEVALINPPHPRGVAVVAIRVVRCGAYSRHPGDFVIWDNRATWHFAIDDYGTGPRAYRKVLGV